MLRGATLALICAGLAGCAQVSGMAEETARETAKTVVTPVVQAKFPGVPVAPVTDCIIDNATLPEVYGLAKAAALGITPETTETIVSIASRPETVTCIAKASLPIALEGLVQL